jgi:hypothetical protein
MDMKNHFIDIYMQQEIDGEKCVLMFMRFQVLMEVSMKMTVFWDVTPCSLVDVYQHFRGACCLHHKGDPDDQSG